EAFTRRFEREIVSGTALEFVEAKLAERDARHLHFGDSRYMLEPNVKDGKGALRDLHTLWWLARYVYGARAVKDLVGMKLLTPEEYRSFERAQRFLWGVRIHLHYLAARPEERLTFDHQHALAVAMGFQHPSANRATLRFMRRYFAQVRIVGALTRIVCALLEEDKKRKARQPMAWFKAASWRLGNFRLDGERLSLPGAQAAVRRPVLMIELFRAAQMHRMDIHPRALQWIARHLRRIDDRLRKNPRASALFLDILLDKNDAEPTLRRMSEAGVLGRFIPEFGRVIGQTQFNMYHVFTVDEHTLVAIGILHAIENGRLKNELPLTSDVIHRISMRRTLYLALFCHDIAKGRGGDHSDLGRKIVRKLAIRLGFSTDEIETAAWLVQHHLLFSNTAFKRDLDDPKTVQDFVREVRTPERLRLLLALTAADIRAVGPLVWNAWKGALMRDLYRRAEQAMGAGAITFKTQQAGMLRRELLTLLSDWSEREIDAYLEQGNPGFLASLDLPRHAAVARMLKESARMALPLLLDTQHDYVRTITEIMVVTADRHRLFSRITGAMALAGANITGARIFTLKNGMAVDLFQVQDASSEVFDRPDKLARMSVYIEQALAGELDLAHAFSKHPPAYRDTVALPGQVFINNDASHLCSVIEISGRDRTGFLHDVTRVMADLGLTVATAHISTYGAQVADVFYVKDIFGMKIAHAAKVKQVREALLKEVGG
ncbi:MAG: [protein-PII] uridylyltransferase, partial [Pseudomonadota bacterium]|nr:[protein-PII] uridylyltransferase [Pseudomonadota bacterium]